MDKSLYLKFINQNGFNVKLNILSKVFGLQRKYLNKYLILQKFNNFNPNASASTQSKVMQIHRQNYRKLIKSFEKNEIMVNSKLINPCPLKNSNELFVKLPKKLIDHLIANELNNCTATLFVWNYLVTIHKKSKKNKHWNGSSYKLTKMLNNKHQDWNARRNMDLPTLTYTSVLNALRELTSLGLIKRSGILKRSVKLNKDILFVNKIEVANLLAKINDKPLMSSSNKIPENEDSNDLSNYFDDLKF